MKKYFIFSISFFIFTLVFWPGRGQAAEKFSFNEKSTWELKADSTVNVDTTLEVTNKTANYYSTGFEFYITADSLSNLTASYADGGKINSSQSEDKQTVNGLNYSYKKVSLDFSRQIVGEGSSFTVNISYTLSGSLIQKGQTYELSLPNFASGEVSQQITIKSPKSFGSVHFLSDDPVNIRSDQNFNYFSFTDKLLTNKQQTVVFGDLMSRELSYNYPIQNIDILPSFFKFYLPMDNDRQSVYVKAVSPEPAYKGKTSDGSNFLYFFLWPGQKINVTATLQILTKAQPATFDKGGKIAEIPADFNTYLSPATYWQTTDPTIRAKASELIKSDDSVFNNTERVYDFIVATFSYNQAKIKDNVRVGAVAALGKPDYVVCQEYADLMVALLRAGGIPAREFYGMTDTAELQSSEGNILHAWVEVYIPRFGWLVADPTWGEAGLKFGKMAFDHLAINYDSGEDYSRPIVLRNNHAYDYGQIYVANAKMIDTKEAATGDSLPAADLTEEKLLDNSRVYLLWAIGGLAVIIFISSLITRGVRRKADRSKNIES
jgi:transglutaminase-like putative cysteine protease